jgi:hypothetical protein
MEHCLALPFALFPIVPFFLHSLATRYDLSWLLYCFILVLAQPSRSLVTFPYCLSCIASLFVILTHGGYVACSYSI